MGPGSEMLGARSRKDFDASAPQAAPLSSTPTSFRLATEEMLMKNTTTLADSDPGSDSTYGVRSLQDSMYEAPPKDENPRPQKENDDGFVDDDGMNGGRRRSTLKPKQLSRESLSETVEQTLQMDTANSSPLRPGQQRSPPPSMSHSLTSLSLDSQAPLSSVPSSPKSTSNRSYRHSDEDSMDEGGSQAIFSSEEDDVEPSGGIEDSAPQLIMPSIKMPSRRPFTERGKNMGRLKMLIAGDSGVGKTSFIKSVVQTCEDIVHVDFLNSNSPSIDKLPSRKSKGMQDNSRAKSTQQITEIYASTKAYPPWWSEIEDTKLLRRRKSMGDTVLERNLCFVDTPGYSRGMSRMEGMEVVLRYIESQLNKPFSGSNMSESDVVGLLSGVGGSQVDVVFYLISGDLEYQDVVFLQRLASFTNVIPLISKSDTLSHEEVEVLRRSIAERLRHADIKPFIFSIDGARSPPFTICSAPSDDNENMDASLLMSPDYVQPLIPSELSLVVQQIFEKDVSACLRHFAAMKLVHARRGSFALTLPASFRWSASNTICNGPTASQTSTDSPSGSSQTTVPHASSVSPYIQARLADHTYQEEKLAQIRLAKWAGDLQRSLQNERSRYEAVSRGERAIWLTEKLRECVNDSTSEIDEACALVAPSKERTTETNPGPIYTPGRYGLLDAGDPLGLLRWNEAMRRRGWIAFQVVGSFGILGAMAVWAARTWGFGTTDGYGSWSWSWGWMGLD